jgi:hypothetical protein
MAMMYSVLLAARSPPRFRRSRYVLAEESKAICAQVTNIMKFKAAGRVDSRRRRRTEHGQHVGWREVGDRRHGPGHGCAPLELPRRPDARGLRTRMAEAPGERSGCVAPVHFQPNLQFSSD